MRSPAAGPFRAGRMIGGPCTPVSRFRRGVTIIETIVLMTSVAAMLGLSVIMLQLLIKLDGDLRGRLDAASVLARLAEQFRQDARGAAGARLVEPKPQESALRFEPEPEHVVEYQVKGPGQLVRVETTKGNRLRSEIYKVSRGGAVVLGIDEKNGRRFATLSVDRKAAPNRTDPPRLFRVLVELGRNTSRKSASAPAAGGMP